MPHPLPSTLSEPVQRQLSMYALAAGTAGVSLLAWARPAEGKIVYTPTNVTISGHGPGAIYHLDLNHDRQVDFLIQNTSGSPANDGFTQDQFFAIAGRGNGIAASSSEGRALAMAKGSQIGSRQIFRRVYNFLESARGLRSGLQYYGNWKNVKNHYLGLKFLVKNKVHYGWARLSVQINARQLRKCNNCHYDHLITAKLTGYAYETIPNKPIAAGQTKGLDVTTEPATLATLALGRR